MLKKLLIGAAFASVVVTGIGLSPASADPRKGQLLPLHCDVLGDITVVVFSNADMTPGLRVGSTQVGIPYKLHVSSTFTPTGGSPETDVQDITKPAPRNGRLDHCTFHIADSSPYGSFVADGEVWISYTPLH